MVFIKKDYTSTICTQLSCRKSPNDVCISYPGGPADGTICGSGQVIKLKLN